MWLGVEIGTSCNSSGTTFSRKIRYLSPCRKSRKEDSLTDTKLVLAENGRGCKSFTFNTLQTVWWFTPTCWTIALVLDSCLSATIFKMLSYRLGLRTVLRWPASCLVRWNIPVLLIWRYKHWKILGSGIHDQETARDSMELQLCCYHLHGRTRNACLLFSALLRCIMLNGE